MSVFPSTLSLIGEFIAHFWWIFVSVLLLFVFLDLRRFYKEHKKRREMKWSLLEIVPPKEVKKSPKAMEQIFAAVDEVSKSDGWASFEIVGRAGATHFFVRIPEIYRNLIESSIYAQYPEAEVNLIPEHEGYTSQFPSDLPNNIYDVWGTELILAREDFYPIRTYPDFKESGKEEETIDPIAGITEIMSKLKEAEAIWLQILVKQADNKEWNKKAENFINEITGKKKEEDSFDWISSWAYSLSEFLKNLFKAAFEPPTWAEREEKKAEEKAEVKKNKIIESIENKMAKIFFHSAIRFVYIDRRDEFDKSNIAGVMGALRQFNTNNLNALTENKKAKTKIGGGFFKEKRLESRKKRIFSKYITRDFPSKSSILNIEELATLYHFPTTGVKSPFLKRVPAKRGGPPPNLPVE